MQEIAAKHVIYKPGAKYQNNQLKKKIGIELGSHLVATSNLCSLRKVEQIYFPLMGMYSRPISMAKS